MADRPRKPSDDPLFWYGVEGVDEVGKHLFDVLALSMCEFQQWDEQDRNAPFDRFRKVLYGHMDELAYEMNLRAGKIVIDSRLLKIEMELYLAISQT